MNEEEILERLAVEAREQRDLVERASPSPLGAPSRPSEGGGGAAAQTGEPVFALSAAALDRMTLHAAAQLRRPRGGRVVAWGAAAGALAVAAAVAVGVAWHPAPSAVSLPAYAVEVRSGASEHRAVAPSSQGVAIVDDGSETPVEIVLRPDRSAEPVTAYVFVERAGLVVEARDASVESSSEGGVRVRGPAAMTRGATALRVVVVASSRSIDERGARAMAEPGATPTSAVRVVVVPVASAPPPR